MENNTENTWVLRTDNQVIYIVHKNQMIYPDVLKVLLQVLGFFSGHKN